MIKCPRGLRLPGDGEPASTAPVSLGKGARVKVRREGIEWLFIAPNIFLTAACTASMCQDTEKMSGFVFLLDTITWSTGGVKNRLQTHIPASLSFLLIKKKATETTPTCPLQPISITYNIYNLRGNRQPTELQRFPPSTKNRHTASHEEVKFKASPSAHQVIHTRSTTYFKMH